MAALLTAAGCLSSSAPPAAPAVTHRAASTRSSWHSYGRSARGQELLAWSAGPANARSRVLVVGVIHGNERGGDPIARELIRGARLRPGTELLVVPDANPDGSRAGTRQNARRVDLNRNFPYRWRRLGHPGDQQYAGTGPLSEPESRALAGLIKRFRPTVSVWFHQPVGVVDESGGSLAVERRFAGIIGLPLRRLQRYPGSAVSWENVTYPGTTSFVVELPRSVSAGLRTRAVAALRDLEH